MKTKTEEITYTLGKLAKKVGVSRDYLLKHLRETGLIRKCFRDHNRYLRIPYSVAIRISGPEALSTQAKSLPRNTSPSFQKAPQTQNIQNTHTTYIKELSNWLARSGISILDLMELQKSQKGERNE